MNGEPLLLLPGMMCDARLFGPQIAAFSGSRKVIVPPAPSQATTADMAAAVLADAPDRFALAGLSMGGIVAMEVMAQAPGRVTRLALLDTNPLAERPEAKARRARQMQKAREGGLARVMRDEMKPSYVAVDEGRQAVLDLCMAMALDLGPDVFLAQSVALRDRPDRRDVLARVQVPALVLCGRHDALCPVERHELMHDLIRDSRLTVVEGAGHLPVLEKPDETNEAIRAWLETT